MAAANTSVPASLDFDALRQRVAALHSDRGHRDSQGEFFVEGVRNLVQALDAGFEPVQIMYSEKLLIAPLARKLVRQRRRAGIRTHKLSPERFRTLSRGRRASGVAAIFRQHWSTLQTVSPDDGLCWVLLETVRSSGNLGTLIRSSSAVGGAGFILVGQDIDPFAPDTLRASMGAIFNQRFVRSSWRDVRRWTRKKDAAIIGATPSGSMDLHRFPFPRSARLIFLGEERQGLTPLQVQHCDHLLRIPMEPGTDSLNLGVAGSLMLYEVYRNRTEGAGSN